jgi:hypothetical protein
MRVRLTRRIVRTMRMLMVFVVHMRMCVSHWSMEVCMLMMLSNVKPHPHGHESSRYGQLRGQGFG